jgi:hypothetical protein
MYFGCKDKDRFRGSLVMSLWCCTYIICGRRMAKRADFLIYSIVRCRSLAHVLLVRRDPAGGNRALRRLRVHLLGAHQAVQPDFSTFHLTSRVYT